MTLYFDTETTGFIKKTLPLNHPAQPRIVQFGAILLDNSNHTVAEVNLLVQQPEGSTIPEQAAAVHGITDAMCKQYGLPLMHICAIYKQLITKATLVVNHNLIYDLEMMELSIAQVGKQQDFPIPSTLCTMRTMTDTCHLPSPRGGFKWPTLQETHQHCFSFPFVGAHDAMADVRAVIAIHNWMKENNHPATV